MKIVLSGISRSGDSDDIGEFMKKVDDDINRMSSLPSNRSTLGLILKATKEIMDQFSQVVHFTSLNLIIVLRLIEATRYTRYSMHRGPLFPVFTTWVILWSETIWIWYDFTCGVGCTGDGSPGWFHTTTGWLLARNVGYCKYGSSPASDPEHIQCHWRHRPSIATGCFAHSWIYETVLAGDSLFYPDKHQVWWLLFFTVRPLKIQFDDLKSRIDTCQKDCASLKDKFFSRIHLDTNKQVRAGLRQNGTFLLVFWWLFSNLFTMGK